METFFLIKSVLYANKYHQYICQAQSLYEEAL